MFAGLLAGAAAAAAEAPCDIDYRIAPRLDAQPRHLEVAISFEAGGRSATGLRTVPSWAGVDDFSAHLVDFGVEGGTVTPHPSERHRWQVKHPAEGRVTVRFRALGALKDPDATQPQQQEMLYRTQLGLDWFQFFGYGVLLTVDPFDDRTQPVQCLRFDGVAAGAPIVTSHGTASGPAAAFRVKGSPFLTRHAFYAGGKGWTLDRRTLPSGEINIATRGEFPMKPGEFSDAVVRLISAHRRFWGDEPEPPQLVALTPNHLVDNTGGTLVHRAAVMHGPQGFSPASPSFHFLVAHENLHQWIPDRIGERAMDGGDAGRYWFSEGFTDFYTHRLLLQAGLWSLDDYARTLNRKIRDHLSSPVRRADNERVRREFFSDRTVGQLAYQRGEFIALRWHAALLRSQPGGMDAVMRSLLVPRDEPAASGRGLAVDRLMAALKSPLPDAADDVERFIVRGEDFAFEPHTLGPCFSMELRSQTVWQLGFDRASFKSMKVSGVDPDGPAHAAGLRDGQVIAGMSVYGGDVDKDALVQLRESDGSVRDIVYRPVSRQPMRVPAYTPRPDAHTLPACRAWIGM